MLLNFVIKIWCFKLKLMNEINFDSLTITKIVCGTVCCSFIFAIHFLRKKLKLFLTKYKLTGFGKGYELEKDYLISGRFKYISTTPFICDLQSGHPYFLVSSLQLSKHLSLQAVTRNFSFFKFHKFKYDTQVTSFGQFDFSKDMNIAYFKTEYSVFGGVHNFIRTIKDNLKLMSNLQYFFVAVLCGLALFELVKFTINVGEDVYTNELISNSKQLCTKLPQTNLTKKLSFCLKCNDHLANVLCKQCMVISTCFSCFENNKRTCYKCKKAIDNYKIYLI